MLQTVFKKSVYLVSHRTFVIFILLIASFNVYAATGKSFHFTNATGRAAITQNVTPELARMRALEDALYLAALQGGANVNGFSSVSTDTSVQDYFVVRPSSKILDYTILSENKSETQIEVNIRAAVGNLPERKCQRSRPLNFTLYKPHALINMNVPSWIDIYHSTLFNKILFSLNQDPLLSVNNAMDVTFSPKKLETVDERFDYSSLISPQVRVKTGDYAVIPTLSITSQDVASRFLVSREIQVTLGMKIFRGGTYDLVENFEQSTVFENDRIALFQTMADLDKRSREDLIEIMEALIKPLTQEIITTLGCQPLTDTINLNSEQLTTQIGSDQGIKPNMLAITSGQHTPWTMFRVLSVSENNAILEPLDKARKLSDLDGKTVEFMEFN